MQPVASTALRRPITALGSNPVVSWFTRPPAGRMHRRTWSKDRRAHIEVRGAEGEYPPRFARGVVEMLESLEGVSWARLNGALGRVVVEFDPATVSVRELVDEVAAAEDEHGLSHERFPATRPDHPGDAEPVFRNLAVAAADVSALGVATLARLLRASPLPIELAAIVSFVDNQPRLRRILENAVGPSVADVCVALAAAGAQGVAQGPTGLLIDAVSRLNVVTELRARRRCWEAREPDLSATPERAEADSLAVPDRASALRPGPLEAHADRAAALALAAGGASLLATRDIRAAAGTAIATTPKAARAGRTAFVCELGRSLAGRGVVVFDQGALERLDRVDVVALSEDCLETGNLLLEDLVHLSPRCDPKETSELLANLLDPGVDAASEEVALRALTPDALRRAHAVDVAHRIRSDGLVIKGLFDSRGLIALAGFAPEIHPVVDAITQIVRTSRWRLHLAGTAGPEIARFVSEAHPETDLFNLVRRLQDEDHVVMSVSKGDPVALAASDCGIGLTQPGRTVPWGAHLLARDPSNLLAILEGASAAAGASRRSVHLNWAGTATAAVMAVGSGQPARRALQAVNGAAAAAFAAGTASAYWAARRAHPPLSDRRQWHSMPAARVLEELGTGFDGLDEGVVESHGQHHRAPSGVNRAVRSMVDELRNPLTPLLTGGALLSAAAGSLVDAGIIGSVTGLGAGIGAVQRMWTDRAVAGLIDKTTSHTTVVRGGNEQRATSEELVVGDVVILVAGDVVPADCRILVAKGVEVDESAITGESLPVAKTGAATFSRSLAERSSMLYEGTTMASGQCRAVVVATGSATEARRGISRTYHQPKRAGVERRIAELTKVTMPIALGAGALVLGGSVLGGRRVNEAMRAGVALAVAAVPEGLPFVVTAAQLAAARRLSDRGALVKRPRTIEALGRLDVLCVDKTGTLTEGDLRLNSVSNGANVEPADTLSEKSISVLAAALRATPQPRKGHKLPHPTDRGVERGARDAGVDTSFGRPNWHRLGDLEFEPGRGYHATLGQVSRGWTYSVKGAPEVVIGRCSGWRQNGHVSGLTPSARRKLSAHVTSLAARGLRVLAVAEKQVAEPPGGDRGSEDLSSEARDLDLLGFVCLADAPRPRAESSVQRLSKAGVQLIMLTGDHPETAAAVADELGLLNGHKVVTGDEVERMSEEQLKSVVREASVFARVTPLHKGAIVSALQDLGCTVAMTGDGANDAPAIRMADVGIALGPRSTPAARAAADMVVPDARLDTILEAIFEGRVVWSAVRDSLSILLGGNLGEIGFTVAATLVGGRSPLQARQLLLVNLFTDLAPALVLATRPPDVDAVRNAKSEGPDKSLGAALTRQIALRAATTAAGASGAWLTGRATGRKARADTMGLVALVMTQLGQTVVTGRARPAVLLTSAGCALGLSAIVQTPGLSQVFGCTPLGPLAWSVSLGSSAIATAASVVAPAALSRAKAPAQAALRSAP
jgi:cation-transporting ATPase I